jgi:FkbM family methyltransferase
MPPKYTARLYEGIRVFYRPDTSDERVLKEVIDKRCYRRPSVGFEIETGEKWLDLGANIGAFAVYCRIQGATAVCYEPEPVCFSVLLKNAPEFKCYNTAITNSRDRSLEFWMSKDQTNCYRGSCIPSKAKNSRKLLPDKISNLYGGILRKQSYDGVKLDIEGSEGGLIDDWLLPKTQKLCLEYHLSRDPDLRKLDRRLKILRQRFHIVSYNPELDRLVGSGKRYGKSWNDRVIWCCDPKNKAR